MPLLFLSGTAGAHFIFIKRLLRGVVATGKEPPRRGTAPVALKVKIGALPAVITRQFPHLVNKKEQMMPVKGQTFAVRQETSFLPYETIRVVRAMFFHAAGTFPLPEGSALGADELFRFLKGTLPPPEEVFLMGEGTFRLLYEMMLPA